MRTYEQEIQAERERFAFLVQRDGLAAAIELMERNRKIYRSVCIKRNKNGIMTYSDPAKDREYRLRFACASRGISILLHEHRG